MDMSSVQEAPEYSWSENTTPASDQIEEDIEDIVRPIPPGRSREAFGSRSRFMRPPIRRRIHPEDYKVGVTRCQQSFSFPMLDLRASMEGSDVSSSSAITILTSATSSCTDPWSSPGFVEDEEVEEVEQDDEFLLEPKLEPEDEDVNMDNVQETSVENTPSVSTVPVTGKRPRGRPRKHPKPLPEDKAKVTKGRSKTGCLTCRRRKKKCDETKPGCLNCEKNAVTCEGYLPKTTWKSGKEKAEEARIRRVSLPKINLPPLIDGVDTPGDMMFFEHYIFRLSTIFTVEGEQNNAFKDMLLPMAVQHSGLMHSILALSSKHIDYRSPYGLKFLKEHPDVDVQALEERSRFHHDEAMNELRKDIDLQSKGDQLTVPATLGQMLCLVLQTLSDPSPKGEHRIHLTSYQKIIKSCPPESSEFIKFIDEFFHYHICADELISLPQEHNLGPASDDWELPSTIVQPDAVRLLGVSDGLFLFMSKITNIRNTVRERLQNGIEPAVNFTSLHRALQIGAGIKEWKPSWPVGDSRDLAGLLYKQMMWVYLYRTIYPPQLTNWKIRDDLTTAVNDGIALLGKFGPRDPSQTLVLAPAFVLGCAAFEEKQRAPIRKAISVVKAYMEYRNSDTALEVLEEVWRLMDMRDERSWDWQSIAHGMGMDFLAT